MLNTADVERRDYERRVLAELVRLGMGVESALLALTASEEDVAHDLKIGTTAAKAARSIVVALGGRGAA